MNTPIFFRDEVRLLSWSESSSGGCKLVFEVQDGDALEPFKRLGLGKKAGQRFACVLVMIGDDEQPQEAPEAPEAPTPRAKGGDLAKLAGMLCNDPRFQSWIAAGIGDVSPEYAAYCVREMCGVESRAELDHSPVAANRFHELIRKPWVLHIGEG